GPGAGRAMAARRLPGRTLRLRHRRRCLPRSHAVATAGHHRCAGPDRHPRPRLAPTAMTGSVAWGLVRSGHLVRSLRLAPFVASTVAAAAFLAVRRGETHDGIADLRVLG